MQSPPPPPPPPNPTYHPPNIEDGGHAMGRPKSSGLTFCLSVSHNLTQLFLGGVVVIALTLPDIDLSKSYTQHVILCTAGYFVLMTQAVLSFSPFGCAGHLKYENKRLIHALMQIVGASFAIAGSIIRLVDVNTNFETPHGIFGFIAMILAVASLLGGIFNLIFTKLSSKLMKILHSLVGCFTLIMAFVAIIFAFNNHYREVAGDRNANIAVSFSVFALVGTLLMAMVRIVRRILNC